MLVMEVVLILFILIIEFLRVRVRGLLWVGCSELKFFGNNFESFMNLLERIFFISLGGSLCIEFGVCWDVEERLLMLFLVVL